MTSRGNVNLFGSAGCFACPPLPRPPGSALTPLRCDRGLIAEAVKELLFTAAGGYYAAQSGKSRKATPCDSTVRRESAVWSRWLRKKARAKGKRGTGEGGAERQSTAGSTLGNGRKRRGDGRRTRGRRGRGSLAKAFWSPESPRMQGKQEVGGLSCV